MVLPHHGVVLSGTSTPGVAQYDLDHCHVGDYKLGSCGTSMRDICYFFAEQQY